MGLSICPAAIVAAPVEDVWALLATPERMNEWIDGKIERAEPPSPFQPGQVLHITSRALGKTWHVTFNIKMVDAERHRFQFSAMFPLGIRLDEHLSCTPINATSCRVQYG